VALPNVRLFKRTFALTIPVDEQPEESVIPSCAFYLPARLLLHPEHALVHEQILFSSRLVLLRARFWCLQFPFEQNATHGIRTNQID
jgi:hypothetical protein